MQIHLSKAEGAIHIRVEIDKTEPALVQNCLMTSDGSFDGHTDTTWKYTRTEAHDIFSHSLAGVWAINAVLFWLSRLPRDIGFSLKWDETQGKEIIDRNNCRYENIAVYVEGALCETREQVEAALSPGDQCHDLGVLQLLSGSVRATDPCYQRDSWCSQTFAAVPGIWLAQCLTGPTNWYHRVKALRIRHPSVAESIFEDGARFSKVGTAGVDSGQCGFFDDTAYPTVSSEFEHEDGTFYKGCCDLTLNRRAPGGGVIGAKYGVVSASGFGDGSYSVLVANNEQGQALAAVLLFIGDDEEDEDGEN